MIKSDESGIKEYLVPSIVRGMALGLAIIIGSLVSSWDTAWAGDARPAYLKSSSAAEAELPIEAKAAILVDEATGKVLFAKNTSERRAPASLTKLLTARLVLEKGKLDDIVTVTAEDLALEGGYATPYLYAGEKLTVRQLLEALIVKSANAAGNTLARYVDGSYAKFVKRMNKRAKRLGCKNTHFENTYGHTHPLHYSTAYDIYLMTRGAVNEQSFKEILQTKTCVLPNNDVYKGPVRRLNNITLMLREKSRYYDARVKGGKTGYTKAAGQCLFVVAEAKGQRLTAIILGGTIKNGVDQRYVDAKRLLDYGFTEKEAFKPRGKCSSISP